jgi:hypothetical protein
MYANVLKSDLHAAELVKGCENLLRFFSGTESASFYCEHIGNWKPCSFGNGFRGNVGCSFDRE